MAGEWPGREQAWTPMKLDSMAETDLNLSSDSSTQASWIIRLMSFGPFDDVGIGLVPFPKTERRIRTRFRDQAIARFSPRVGLLRDLVDAGANHEILISLFNASSRFSPFSTGECYYAVQLSVFLGTVASAAFGSRQALASARPVVSHFALCRTY